MTENTKRSRAPNQIVNLKLRFDEDLRQRLEAEAKASNVSMNSYVVEGLQRLLAIGDGLNDFRSISLWRDLDGIIGKVEQLTGEKWQSDRKTFVAVAQLIDARLKDQQPPLANEAAVLDHQRKLVQFQTKIEGLLGLLLDAGAIRSIADSATIDGRTTKMRGLLNPLLLANPSSESVIIIRLLQDLDYEPTVRLDDPVRDWKLEDDVALDAEGAQTIFKQLPRLANELNVLRKNLLEAYRPNDLAEEEGKQLAQSLRQRMAVSDDFRKVD